MAIGKRKRERQETLWIATQEIPTPPAHPFYHRLNEILKKNQFDDFVEGICAKFYAPRMGRPGLIPGIYFRLLLIGYFEGLDSERGIAWRTADSLALRGFLGLTHTDTPPEHSTISRTRRLFDLETHQSVFTGYFRELRMQVSLREKPLALMPLPLKLMQHSGAS